VGIPRAKGNHESGTPEEIGPVAGVLRFASAAAGSASAFGPDLHIHDLHAVAFSWFWLRHLDPVAHRICSPRPHTSPRIAAHCGDGPAPSGSFLHIPCDRIAHAKFGWKMEAASKQARVHLVGKVGVPVALAGGQTNGLANARKAVRPVCSGNVHRVLAKFR